MCEALRRLMKDEIEEALDAAKQEGSAEGHIQAQRETSIALAKMGMAVELLFLNFKIILTIKINR